MKRVRNHILPFGVLAGLIAMLGACGTDEIIGEPAENQAPTVWIAAAPPEGSTGSYTVQLYWGGWDPDGEIAYYEYFVTDNVTGVFDPADTVDGVWSAVYANDSTFTFKADSLSEGTNNNDQTYTFTRSHTFFIRAVDEAGLRSQEPAYRSFTSRTISPEVNIRVPRADLGITPADIPPISTISWTATDYVDDMDNKQDPDSVQWALVSTKLFNNSYAQTIAALRSPVGWDTLSYPWSWYKAPQDSGKNWTTPPLDFGQYVFAIRAKDEAGAVTPVLEEPDNIRRLKVAERSTGPVFVVTSVLIGAVIAASCDYPLTILDVPSGVDIVFTLSACADHYGGTVAGYRYGWDILDLNDPDQWEIDYTPFVGSFATTPPRAFNFGTHTFTAEVIDNSGFCSRIEIKLNIIRFTGGRNLLIVDDYSPDEVPGQNGWDATAGGVPSDAEHDGFWLNMVSDLEGFDPASDMLPVTQLDESELPLTTIADYKNIIWSVFGHVNTTNPSDLPLLYAYIQYRSKRPPSNTGGACGATGGTQGKVVPNYVGLAMQAGVHVMIAGHHPVQNVIPRRGAQRVTFPVIPIYELETFEQRGSGPSQAFLNNPPGNESFTYRELCIDVLDYAYLTPQIARLQGTGANRKYCPVWPGWREVPGSIVDNTMRGGTPADPNFQPITLRPEAAGSGRAYAPAVKGIDVEVYNPAYFRQGAACTYVPQPRPCFEPVYMLDCFDTTDRTYQQPIAFWTGAYGDVIGDDIPGGVAARSIVFGFPPVYFNPSEFKPGLEYILYDEWQLRRKTVTSSASMSE